MNRSFKTGCAAAAGAIAITILGGAVLPVVVTDNFNNNSINQGLWNIHQFGGVAVNEAHKRLEFSGNGSTGLFSFAALEVEHWGANWKKGFTLSFNYKLALESVPADRSVFLGVGFAPEGTFPESLTGIALGLRRDSEGLGMGWIRYENGVEIASDGIPLEETTGLITVVWDKGLDRMVVSREDESVAYDGLFAELGGEHGGEPMVISVGCATRGGNISFPGSKVFMDNFATKLVKKGR